MPVGHIAMARSTVSLCEIQRICIISRKRRDKKHENNAANQSPTCPHVAVPSNGSFVQSFHRRALPFPFHNSRCPSLLRDSGKIKFPGIVPGFVSDVVTPTEHPKGICFAAQNRRRSSSTSRILRLRRSQRCPEDGMRDGGKVIKNRVTGNRFSEGKSGTENQMQSTPAAA
jgi:hypothetical protein